MRKICLLCSNEVKCKGLCSKHYQWERFHQLAGHGQKYFIEYVAKHKELGSRGRIKLEQARAMSRGRLRAA